MVMDGDDGDDEEENEDEQSNEEGDSGDEEVNAGDALLEQEPAQSDAEEGDAVSTETVPLRPDDMGMIIVPHRL